MREETVQKLQYFINELRATTKLVLRTPWGRDTLKGHDALQHLDGIAKIAATLSEKVSSEEGPVEDTLAQRLMDLERTAKEVVADWPDEVEVHRESVKIAANRLQTFVFERFSGDVIGDLSFS